LKYPLSIALASFAIGDVKFTFYTATSFEGPTPSNFESFKEMRIESIQMRRPLNFQKPIVKPVAYNLMVCSIMLQIVHSVLEAEHLEVATLACILTIGFRGTYS
jgi:hypothetical protein